MNCILKISGIFLCALFFHSVEAATMTVDTPRDGELSALAHDGQCSLREAIEAVNTRQQVDTCAVGVDNSIRFDFTKQSPNNVLLPFQPNIVSSAPVSPASPSISGAVFGPAQNTHILQTQTRILLEKELQIKNSVQILGPNNLSIIIDGQKKTRVFFIKDQSHSTGVVVRFENLMIENGKTTGLDVYSDGGAGIYLGENNNLFLEKVVVRNNSALMGGGGIFNNLGTLTVRHSLIQSNTTLPTNSTAYETARGVGGGLMNNGGETLIINSSFVENRAVGGGGIHTQNSRNPRNEMKTGRLHLVNTTLSGNESTGIGGGLSTANYTQDVHDKIYLGLTTLSNVTLVHNKASHAAGYYNNGELVIANSIVTNNVLSKPADNLSVDCYQHRSMGITRSLGYNFFSNLARCDFDAKTGDQTKNPVSLKSLATQEFGKGVLLYHLPETGSPVIDGGNPAGCLNLSEWPTTRILAQDKLGQPRAQDGNGNGVPECDAGAVEVAALTPALVICGDAKRDGAEECDDGNTLNTDDCTNACRLNVCGDMILHPTREECDDGNQNGEDACSNQCKKQEQKKDSSGSPSDTSKDTGVSPSTGGSGSPKETGTSPSADPTGSGTRTQTGDTSAPDNNTPQSDQSESQNFFIQGGGCSLIRSFDSIPSVRK